jgi:hypothetical protein
MTEQQAKQATAIITRLFQIGISIGELRVRKQVLDQLTGNGLTAPDLMRKIDSAMSEAEALRALLGEVLR